jgi:hypothetical protein
MFLSFDRVTRALSVRVCIFERIFAISKTSKKRFILSLFCFCLFFSLQIYPLLLRLNSSTKANGRYHCCSLDPERGEKTAAPPKNPFQTQWNCRKAEN